MESHKYADLSESEQMYLVTMAQLEEKGLHGPFPLSDVAESLGVLPVSVNQMVRRLADMGLVEYLPYKGVDFTSEGRNIVRQVLRNRRLWEMFLVKHLYMTLEEADAQACRMEHITTDQVADRLAVFLGNPSKGLHGNPIPRLEDESGYKISFPLYELEVGDRAMVIQLEADQATQSFFNQEGIQTGCELVCLAKSSHGGVLIMIDENKLHLSKDVSKSVFIEKKIAENQPNMKEQSKQKEKYMQKEVIPLSKMKIGQQGKIVENKTQGSARQRFMAMGLVKGENVRVERIAPLGDPIDFVVKDYHLSLRKQEAQDILVELS
jgi:DtxR family transcriptional regulator, Mn-dependent transcriptional regulator